MKNVLCLTVGFLLCIAAAYAQKVAAPAALQSLVATERAFARTSADKGTREAFLSFIADDGILFRPAAVNGKKWMQDNPVPPSKQRPLLYWQPIFADVSLAGDLGYTTGPWEYKADIKDEKPAGYGNFVTLWKKQLDGSWKFVVDLGITNPQPPQPLSARQFPVNYGKKSEQAPAKVDVESGRGELINRDREFSQAAATRGTLEAFLSYSAKDVRLFRNDSFPFVGKEAATQALANNQNPQTWQPASADVASSGDLGYTSGTYEIRSNDGAKALIEKGNYVRIWKRHDGAWELVVDVANPLP
jgi:ketosteroid isomerase-like protein